MTSPIRRAIGHACAAATLAITAVCSPRGVTVAEANPFCSSNSFNAVYLTVTKIDAHLAQSKGFSTLAAGGPTQVNLLAPNDGTAQGACMLGALGDINGLPVGRYGQIRIMLADNNGAGSPPSTNACQSVGHLGGNVVNCVEYTPNAGSPTWAPMAVGSAAKTGWKVPPAQVEAGGLVVQNGELLDLLVTMDPCKSLLAEGFGQGNGKGNGAKKFRLKPTLHRDELALTPFVAGQIVEGSISGASVNTTTTPVAGADVWLENVGSPFAKPSSSLVNVNNVVGSTTSDSNGDFEFCPTGPGTYEVASDAAGVGSGSDATITTGVSVTSGAGVNSLMIPLVAAGKATGFKAEFDSDGMTGAAVVYGGAQSDNGSNAGTSFAQVPFLDGTAPNPSVTTSPSGCGGKCSNSAPACACVTLAVPNDGPVIGSAGGSYTLDSENLAVDGRAAACSNGAGESLITDPSGAPPTSPTLSFTGCP